LLRFKCNRKAD